MRCPVRLFRQWSGSLMHGPCQPARCRSSATQPVVETPFREPNPGRNGTGFAVSSMGETPWRSVESAREKARDCLVREVREVHHTDSGGGTAMGMMLGIVLVVAVLAVAAFFLFNGAFRSSGTPQTNSPTNIQVNPPPQAPAPSGKVDVNVNPPAQSAPSKP